MTNNSQISIVVPVYNSSKSLDELNQRIQDTLNSISENFEIVYIDDNSKDSSWDILTGISDSFENVRIYKLLKNCGQWEASLYGIELAKHEIIVTIDDDLQFSPEDIVKIYKCLIENELWLVYGIPKYVKTGNTIKHIRNELLNFFLKKGFTSSFKVFKRNIILSNENRLNTNLHFEAHAQLTIDKKKIGIVTVLHNNREQGISNYSFLKKINLVLKYGGDYYTTPVSLFVVCGFALLLPIIAMLLSNYLNLEDNNFIGFWIIWALIFMIVIGSWVASIFVLRAYLKKRGLIGKRAMKYDIFDKN